MTAVEAPRHGHPAHPPRRTRQGHRHRHLRLRVPGRRPAVPAPGAGHHRQRPHHRHGHRRRRGARRRRWPSSPSSTRRRLADTSDGDLTILQDDQVHYRGQLIGAVVADTAETARQAADLVRVEYDGRAHDTEIRADHPGLYAPEQVNPSFPTDTVRGRRRRRAARGAGRRRPDVHDAAREQQPDGAARHASRSGIPTARC